MTFKAPDSLAEQIAQHLAQRIIRGELKARERIQEQKVTQALDVSRSSVREALLILERRHLISMLPHRGAQVAALRAHDVRHLYALTIELYGLLATAVCQGWRDEAGLAPFRDIQRHLVECAAREDIEAFVEHSFAVLDAACRISGNPYLEATLDNLRPAIRRTYYLALERRRGEMSRFLDTFDGLLRAVFERDGVTARALLRDYGEHNCRLVLASLDEQYACA